MSRRHLVPLNIFATTTQPTPQRAGDAYFDFSSNKLKIYNGTSWLEFTPTDAAAAEIFVDGGLFDTTFTDLADGGFPDSNYTLEGEYDGGGVWSTANYPDGPPYDFYDGGIFSTIYTDSLDGGAYNTVYSSGIDSGNP